MKIINLSSFVVQTWRSLERKSSLVSRKKSCKNRFRLACLQTLAVEWSVPTTKSVPGEEKRMQRALNFYFEELWGKRVNRNWCQWKWFKKDIAIEFGLIDSFHVFFSFFNYFAVASCSIFSIYIFCLLSNFFTGKCFFVPFTETWDAVRTRVVHRNLVNR